MKSNPVSQYELQIHLSQLEKNIGKISLGQVFAEGKYTYLNAFNLFIAHFHTIPNFIDESNIDCRKANKWFIESYRSEIKDWHYSKRCFSQNQAAEFDDIYHILYDDLIVNFNVTFSTARFLFRKKDVVEVEAIISEIQKFRKKKEKRKPGISNQGDT